MNSLFKKFKYVVVYDYEFKITDGNPPKPVCVVYKELHKQKIYKVWCVDKFPRSLFPIDETLFIAHYSNAEVFAILHLVMKNQNIFGTLS